MWRNAWVAVPAAIALVTCTSCATLFQGTHEEIALASDPSGATATVDDGRNGVTPYSIHTNRDQDIQVHFSKPGYQSEDISDASHVEWGYLVSDIFFTGLIGLAVDGLDGAMFSHSQQMVSAHLEPLPNQTAATGTASSASAVTSAPVATAAVPASATQDPNEHF